MTPKDLGLPFDSWVPGQEEALQRVMASSKKLVLLEAPPGVGKSGISVAISRALDLPPTVILTGTKQLQDQYMNLPSLVQVRGRGNFECKIEPILTAAEAACTVGGKCGYAGNKGMSGCCLVPETRVLTTDLRWVPVGQLQVGDKLIGFDEHAVNKQRKYKPSVVEATGRTRLPCWRIVTNRGAVVASGAHLWHYLGGPSLSHHKTTKKEMKNGWIQTDELKPGSLIGFYTEPWETDQTYDAGYLAGFLDGEGSTRRNGIVFGQNPGDTLQRVLGLLCSRGYDPHPQFPTNAQGENIGSKKCLAYYVSGGNRGALRLIGSIRPTRMLMQSERIWNGRGVGGGSKPAVVQSIEYVGEQEVVMLQTSTQTLIAEGFRSHNSFYDQRRAAIEAEEVVTNYPFFLLQPPRSFKSPKLLVMDECHQIRGQLESAITLSLRASHFINSGLGEIAEYEDGAEALEWIISWANLVFDKLRGLWSRIESQERSAGDISKEERRYRAAVNGLLQVAASVRLDPDNWVVGKESWGYELRPIWVRGFIKPFLEKTEIALFMSATILDPNLFLESLGLDPEDSEFIRFDSPFPVANRPLIYWPVAKVSGRDPQSYQIIVSAVDALMEAHPYEKGLVHTVNYSLAKSIMRSSKYGRRLMTHDAKTREGVLEDFKRSTEPMVLVSPSMGVGVDLPGDALRWQAICKLPFPDASDPQRKAQTSEPMGKRLAMYDTATTLIQMYGRAVRSADDYGTTYMLDKNWDWMRQAGKKLWPNWFLNAIQTRGRS